jgi:predicted TIM-barrel fold metal-dependent hydrolase
LFGSDWPYYPDDMTDDMTRALGDENMLDAQALAAVERNNAVKLFPRWG